jgi:hypothetical protein
MLVKFSANGLGLRQAGDERRLVKGGFSHSRAGIVRTRKVDDTGEELRIRTVFGIADVSCDDQMCPDVHAQRSVWGTRAQDEAL